MQKEERHKNTNMPCFYRQLAKNYLLQGLMLLPSPISHLPSPISHLSCILARSFFEYVIFQVVIIYVV